jgi:hypothetical protein
MLALVLFVVMVVVVVAQERANRGRPVKLKLSVPLNTAEARLLRNCRICRTSWRLRVPHDKER